MKKQIKKRSALRSHRVLMILVLLAALVNVIFSFFAVAAVQAETENSAEAAVQQRIDQIYSHFSTINQSLKRILVESVYQTTTELAFSGNTLARINARNELNKKFAYISTEIGTDYSLFFYFPLKNEFLTAYSSPLILLNSREDIENAIAQFCNTKDAFTSAVQSWQLVKADTSYYAVKLYKYQGVIAGSYVPASALAAPLSKAYADKNGFAVILSHDGEIAFGKDTLLKHGFTVNNAQSNKIKYTVNSKRWQALNAQSEFLGFKVKLFYENASRFEQVVVIQALSMAIVAVIFCFVISSMAYTQRRILRPLRAFTDGLKNYNPNEPLLPKLAQEIEELAAASEQFENLTKEISRLKIDAYERELEKQKIQMDYMQLQIKPHFFLNSLNLINTLTKRGDTQSALQLSESTVKYLRHIFQSDEKLMLLEQELLHVQNYFSIMQIRYPDSFSFEIVADDDALKKKLPPLIIQTFVENAVKYALSPARILNICISALCEEEADKNYLNIFITDNGPGFPAENLQSWNSGEELLRKDGAHIGIANARRRIEMQYGEAASLKLYNSPLKGAVVELRIPCREDIK